MIEIVIVRHGETAWNTGDIFRGRVAVPLSETGLKQAEKAGEYLSKKKIKAVYCSPLDRAVQTAAAIAQKQGLTPQPLEGINDQDFGRWEGVAVAEVAEKYPEIYKQWKMRPDAVAIPGGELLSTVRERVVKTLNELMASAKDGETIAIVTHRVITKVLICYLLGLDDSHFWNIEHDTCGVTVFQYHPKYNLYTLKHHNDTSFLG